MRKYVAEFIGTFTLVLIGCGTAVVGGAGHVGIALAFGLALVAMAYSIGPISGCHINPAVTLGFFVAKRTSPKDLAGYVIAQFLGGIAAAAVLLLIANGMVAFKDGYDATRMGLGQNGWGEGFQGSYALAGAFTFELVATFLFVLVVLGCTQPGVSTAVAGLAIGLTLTAIHLFGIPVTGVSVNPARSLGPALFVGGQALAQLWLFLVVPSLAGVLAGFVARAGLFGKADAVSQ